MADKLKIKINKVPLPPNIYGSIIEITVDTDVFMPSMFTMVIDDSPTITGQPLLTNTDNALLYRIGAAVEVSATVDDPPNFLPVSKTIFDGEITSVEPMFRSDGQVHLLIRGYDKSHRLTLGKRTRVWGMDIAPTVTEMQIVGAIASENGLQPSVNPVGLATVLHNYVLQYNQSDWDFLWARARMWGYQVYANGSTLYFTPAALPRNLLPVLLTWGENLQSFKPRFVASGAVTGASVHGWDTKTKSAIKGVSIPGAGLIDPTSSPAIMKGVSGSVAIKTGMSSSAKHVTASPIAKNPAIAATMANAAFLEHESHYVRASGIADGSPNLVAGSLATIASVGIRFAGVYFVTKAVHIYRDGVYNTEFEVSGRNPFTLTHLTGQDPQINTIDGAVVGVVTNVTDPMFQGRVKVKFPWMAGASGDVESAWARLAIIGGGPNGGLYFTPEVNDEVLVVFEHGDLNNPYVIGSLWNGKDLPPKAPAGTAVVAGKVAQRIIKSRSGHVVVLDDTTGKEQLIIQDKNGNGITIDTMKNAMTIKTTGDLTLDIGGKIVIKSKLDFSIDSQTTATITSNSKLAMESKSAINIKASTAELDMNPGATALKGTNVDVQGTANATLKGNAMVTVQGALVKIN